MLYIIKKEGSSDALMQAATWMNLEDKMLRERSQSQKANTVRLYFWETPRGVKFMETERGWGRVNGEMFTGARVSALQDFRDSLQDNVNVLNKAKLYT